MDKEEIVAPVEEANTPLAEEKPTQEAGPSGPGEVAAIGDLFAEHAGLNETPIYEAGNATVFPPQNVRLNKDGTPAKKRGRKPGAQRQAEAAPEVAPETAPAPPPEAKPRLSATQAAKQTANLTIFAAVALCGEEVGVPKSEEEGKNLIATYKDYFDARGVPDLPPEIGLLIGVGTYMIPRLRDERAKSRVEEAKEKIAKFLGKFRRK